MFKEPVSPQPVLPEIKKIESQEDQREAESLMQVMGQLKASKLFDAEYVNHLKMVLFGAGRVRVFEAAHIQESDKQNYSAMDFMTGRRTDFVGIPSRDDLEKMDVSELDDRHFLPFIFFQGKLCFEEAAAHEAAHNMFDIHYKEQAGEYEERDGVTDVSEQYRGRIIDSITTIAKKYLPSFDVSRFEFSRQQIAEIYAQLYEREFCRRMKLNEEAHAGVEQHVAEFIAQPEEMLARLNSENGRNCTIEDLYVENHTLSLLVAPALEKEFPDFDTRVGLFFPKFRNDLTKNIKEIPKEMRKNV